MDMTTTTRIGGGLVRAAAATVDLTVAANRTQRTAFKMEGEVRSIAVEFSAAAPGNTEIALVGAGAMRDRLFFGNNQYIHISIQEPLCDDEEIEVVTAAALGTMSVRVVGKAGKVL